MDFQALFIPNSLQVKKILPTLTMSHGCNSENARSIDKMIALRKSRWSTKPLLKAKATDGIVP
jgi:hypothetical protein